MLAREAEEDRKRREEEMAREEAEEAEARRDKAKEKRGALSLPTRTLLKKSCHQKYHLDCPRNCSQN